MKFKKTPTNKLTRFSIFLVASLLLLLLVIDSRALATVIYGNALASDLLSGKTATTDAGSITGTLALTGNMVASDLLAGKTGYSNNPVTKLTGTMVDRGTVNITPSTGNQAITAGKHSGSGVVYGDADLVTANIKSGANIFNVAGSLNEYKEASGTRAVTLAEYNIVITISGLGFTPRFIYIRDGYNSSTYSQGTDTPCWAQLYGRGDNTAEVQATYLTPISGGFTFKYAGNTDWVLPLTVTWRAYGY